MIFLSEKLQQLIPQQLVYLVYAFVVRFFLVLQCLVQMCDHLLILECKLDVEVMPQLLQWQAWEDELSKLFINKTLYQ